MRKLVKDLKPNDIILSKNKQKCEVISNNNGVIFYYNQSTRYFHTKKANINHFVTVVA